MREQDRVRALIDAEDEWVINIERAAVAHEAMAAANGFQGDLLKLTTDAATALMAAVSAVRLLRGGLQTAADEIDAAIAGVWTTVVSRAVVVEEPASEPVAEEPAAEEPPAEEPIT